MFNRLASVGICGIARKLGVAKLGWRGYHLKLIYFVKRWLFTILAHLPHVTYMYFIVDLIFYLWIISTRCFCHIHLCKESAHYFSAINDKYVLCVSWQQPCLNMYDIKINDWINDYTLQLISWLCYLIRKKPF